MELRKMAGCVLSVALIGAAASCGTTDDEAESVTVQDLSGGVYASWGGTMNSAGTAYTTGAPFKIDVGVNINNGWFCELTGIAGNLTGAAENAVSVFPDNAGEWWLQARAAAGKPADASAVCFPVPNANFWEPVPGGFVGSQFFSGIVGVGAVTGNPAQITVSDQGSNPNVSPLHFGTWTLTTSNVNAGQIFPGDVSWAQVWSSYWIWHANSGSFTKTMPTGTSCFLTSITGNLQLNSFSNGAVATENFSTGAWTFTAASGTDAWWLCLN